MALEDKSEAAVAILDCLTFRNTDSERSSKNNEAFSHRTDFQSVQQKATDWEIRPTFVR